MTAGVLCSECSGGGLVMECGCHDNDPRCHHGPAVCDLCCGLGQTCDECHAPWDHVTGCLDETCRDAEVES